jgi:hypothetical protein
LDTSTPAFRTARPPIALPAVYKEQLRRLAKYGLVLGLVLACGEVIVGVIAWVILPASVWRSVFGATMLFVLGAISVTAGFLFGIAFLPRAWSMFPTQARAEYVP